MKLLFKSQQDKDIAVNAAKNAPLEACGTMYRYFLEEGIVDETLEETKVEDTIMVDESVEQII